MKSLFQSKTFWASITAIIGALTPLALNYGDTGEISRKDLVGAVIGALGGLAAIGGRYAATDAIYTPHGIPGRDKEFFTQPLDNPVDMR